MYTRTLKLAQNSKYKAVLITYNSFRHDSEREDEKKVLFSVIIKETETLKELQHFETSDEEMASNYFNEFIKLNNLRIYS